MIRRKENLIKNNYKKEDTSRGYERAGEYERYLYRFKE